MTRPTRMAPGVERSADSVVTTLTAYPIKGVIKVYAHHDGGVTLAHIGGDDAEIARLSVMRETWAAIVSAASRWDPTITAAEKEA